MRRGESKAKSLKREGRTESGGATAKTRAGRKDASDVLPAKKRTAKAPDLNEAVGPKASPSPDENIERLKRALAEAHAREAATANVLKAISRSSFDLQTVLDTLVESAAKLCQADVVAINRPKDGVLVFAAQYGFPPEFLDVLQKVQFAPGRATLTGRVLLERKAVQITDRAADPDYFADARLWAGDGTGLGVPLMRQGDIIGVMVLTRRKVRPFTDKQIELVTTFADQAVIAIENARQFEEVQTSRRELAEALEQQTATSEVLQVISRSPTSLQTVLDSIVTNAARLCEALDAMILFREGEVLVPRAHSGPLGSAPFGQRQPLNRHWVTGRAVLEARTIHVPDLLSSDEYPEGKEMAVRYGHRATLAAPLLRDGRAIGAVLVRRREDRAFTDKQIELVSNFAKQAVIAIENARLLNELRQRTDDLTESLEQQTATSDVLKIISTSRGELKPVFDSMLENAIRLCKAKFGNLLLYDGEKFQIAATHDPPGVARLWEHNTIRPGYWTWTRC